MRDLRTRIPALVALMFLLLTTACASSWAQSGGSANAKPLWPTYHFDSARTGQNNSAVEIDNPASISLIWVFPRAASGGVEEINTIVDDLDPNNCLVNPAWSDSLTSKESYENHFYWNWVIARDDVDQTGKLNKTPTAVEWRFPRNKLDAGQYRIMIWVPAEYEGDRDTQGNPLHHNTSQAEYTVVHDGGTTTVKFDQRIGGEWRLLTNRTFSFSNNNQGVRLSNLTDDTKEFVTTDRTIVVADAVMFVPATGMEIYSSPASAKIPWSVTWTFKHPDYPNDNTSGTWSGEIPVVYVGTVESSLTNDPNAPDTGALYCVNSVTPQTKSLSETKGQDLSKWKEAYALSQYLGTPLWRYPRLPGDRGVPWDGQPDGSMKHELEGPIEGGIYSSPVLARVSDGTTERLICVFTAKDRQVYALDAVTGELIWKGPGLTVSESPNGSLSGWTPEGLREAFGGRFHWAQCVGDKGDIGHREVAWTFTDEDRQAAGEPANEGWSYAVYVWLPPALPGDALRARDATYRITYKINASETKTDEIKIDQGAVANQGRWVKLGSSFFNVQSVTLDNVTKTTASGKNPGDYVVVADACMIVPDTIDAFTYSSPVADVDDYETGTARRVFAVTASGRALSINLQPRSLGVPIARVESIYPKVRTTYQVTGAADADDPPMGEVGASPAYSNSRIYIATMGGKIYCLEVDFNSGQFTEKWVFGQGNDDIDLVDGFSSSPALDKANDHLFIGSIGGVFYCIKASDGTKEWTYPDNPALPGGVGKMPLGAFRYSTPAVGKDKDGRLRAWIASTDGRIYSFAISSSDPHYKQRIYVEYDEKTGQSIAHGGGWYNEPNVLAPIQGSVALDGSKNNTRNVVMYVGDMREEGVLHWFDATNGTSNWEFDGAVYKGWRTEGMLFSSPNLTNLDLTLSGGTKVNCGYVYIGCSDGRVYAFSDEGGAWGGEWSGGTWPFEGSPEDNAQRVKYLEPDQQGIQFDIFPYDFYTKSETTNPEPKNSDDYIAPDSTWDDDWIVSKEMKMPSKDFSSFSGKTLDDEIKKELLKQAKERRKYVFAKTARTTASDDPNSAVYLEWGETLYLILWNLPEMDVLYGSNEASKKANIRFNLANTSAGSSAGSQVRLASNCKTLKEYTVLDKSTLKGSNPATADPLKNSDGDPIKRCYALAQIEIRGTGSRPPSPGPGWVLTAEIRQYSGTDDNKTVQQFIIPLAKLKIGSGGIPEPVLVPIQESQSAAAKTYDYKPQLLGINNPLAIRDDGDRIGRSVIKLAWPMGSIPRVTVSTRNDPEAHFNGNAVMQWSAAGEEPQIDYTKMPEINLNIFQNGNELGVAHGTGSREGWLGVMDRSAVGLTEIPGTNPRRFTQIDRFRIEAGDLRWRGGTQAITDSGGMLFPWELGIGSVDYPHIYKRNQSYRKQSDDGDPSRTSTILPSIVPATPNTYEGSLMRPDTVYISVEVPRFQPANLTGYTRSMEAYIDSDGDQHWDSGDTVYNRPTTYQEAYRRFRVALRVPPDPRIEVDEQLIDVGKAPHGLGQGFDFVPYNAVPEVRQWFKKITVKNAGNVNIYNLMIDKTQPLYLLSDAVNMGRSAEAVPQIPGTEIRSSIDVEMPIDPLLQALKLPPFTTEDPNHAQNLPFRYTLTKPRVGDPDPTILTIPDRRKWDANYRYGTPPTYTQDAAANILAAAWGMPVDKAKASLPLPVEVSLAVPLSQQIGTYVIPFVPVVGMFGRSSVAVADPTFGLKVTVQENKLTGDKSSAVLPQIDDGPFPKTGEATPAAFRDEATGKVHLFYSSNRLSDPDFQTAYPDWSNPNAPEHQKFAAAPWLIHQSILDYDQNMGWLRPKDPVSGQILQRWWGLPGGAPFIPSFSPTTQWPTLIGAGGPGSDVMEWMSTGSKKLQSVNHFSPVIAENRDVPPDAQNGRTWLAWAGTANIRNTGGKISQEHRIFYTDATHGDVTSGRAQIFSIEHEPTMEKRYPSLAVFNKPNGQPRMWMFWQGGENGRWSIYYSTNDAAPAFPTRDSDGNDLWSSDVKLRTPDCLVSVSSPNAVHREFWKDLTGNNSGAKKDLFDMVYAGVSKLSQSPDILLGRYAAVGPNDQNARNAQPGQIAQPLPRVFGEKLQRDPKYGYFTSRHLAWMRLGRTAYENIQRFASPTEKDLLLSDHPGRAEYMQFQSDLDQLFASNPALANSATYNMPYIWVVLPANYAGMGNPAGTIISATDGVIPEFDDATGICTYKYPEGSDAARVLGQTLVDFSAGIVRFTKPLEEVKQPNGTVATPEVLADYTPQTWRLTTDLAVDNSPRSFIERTQMTQQANPGLSDKWLNSPNLDVDRLWVLWRKASTAVQSSTIYWKTYRIGVELEVPIPITWKSFTDRYGNTVRYIDTSGITVTGALGPWEVDATGKRIYFSQVDERYVSLIKSGSKNFLTNPAPPTDVAVYDSSTKAWIPKPIVIEYNDANGQKQTVKAYDVSWIEESPEQSLFGFVGDSSVNEGSVYAFADPDPRYWIASRGTWGKLLSSKIWVFWTSTRGGNSDLCWATLTPNFGAR